MPMHCCAPRPSSIGTTYQVPGMLLQGTTWYHTCGKMTPSLGRISINLFCQQRTGCSATTSTAERCMRPSMDISQRRSDIFNQIFPIRSFPKATILVVHASPIFAVAVVATVHIPAGVRGPQQQYQTANQTSPCVIV